MAQTPISCQETSSPLSFCFVSDKKKGYMFLTIAVYSVPQKIVPNRSVDWSTVVKATKMELSIDIVIRKSDLPLLTSKPIFGKLGVVQAWNATTSELKYGSYGRWNIVDCIYYRSAFSLGPKYKAYNVSNRTCSSTYIRHTVFTQTTPYIKAASNLHRWFSGR